MLRAASLTDDLHVLFFRRGLAYDEHPAVLSACRLHDALGAVLALPVHFPVRREAKFIPNALGHRIGFPDVDLRVSEEDFVSAFVLTRTVGSGPAVFHVILRTPLIGGFRPQNHSVSDMVLQEPDDDADLLDLLLPAFAGPQIDIPIRRSRLLVGAR